MSDVEMTLRQHRELLADQLSADLLRIAAEQSERLVSWKDAERYRLAARMAYGLDLQIKQEGGKVLPFVPKEH